MKEFSHTKKDIGYGQRWTFDNTLWFDMIDHEKLETIFLRVWRGAWLIRQHPILYDLFDCVSKVVAKIQVHSVDTLYEKHVVGIFKLLNEAEKSEVKHMIVDHREQQT